MNRGWTKILLIFGVIAGFLAYLAWPVHMPPPDEKNRARSPGGMSLILPPEWEAVQLKETGDFDDGLLLRPKADGKLQPSILAKRFTAPPLADSLAGKTFKALGDRSFQGKPVWYFEGVTKTENMYRFVFESNARWYQLTLSTPTTITYEGSDWQKYVETFNPAPLSTTQPTTAPSTDAAK